MKYIPRFSRSAEIKYFLTFPSSCDNFEKKANLLVNRNNNKKRQAQNTSLRFFFINLERSFSSHLQQTILLPVIINLRSHLGGNFIDIFRIRDGNLGSPE